jgi:hypothetical protein
MQGSIIRNRACAAQSSPASEHNFARVARRVGETAGAGPRVSPIAPCFRRLAEASPS